MRAKIVAPAKQVDRKTIQEFIKYFSLNEIECELGENLFSSSHYFSASDDQRTTDLQKALDSDEIDVIFCARGGYGTSRIIDDLDFSKFVLNPKLIVGFSDITVLLNHASNLGFPSVHASVGGIFDASNKVKMSSFFDLMEILKGGNCKMEASKNERNRSGKASAEVVGGNLSLLSHIVGTPSAIHDREIILAIEEVDEYLYAIDRMFVQLKRSGIFNLVKGVIIGHFSLIKDGNPSFGSLVEDIVLEHTPSHVPVGFNFPFGHKDENKPFFIGKKAELNVSRSGSSLVYL
ncbi:MAG: LD-carboxypeptidase [Bacteroidota bacterium]